MTAINDIAWRRVCALCVRSVGVAAFLAFVWTQVESLRFVVTGYVIALAVAAVALIVSALVDRHHAVIEKES